MSKAHVYLRNLTVNWVGFAANLVVMFFLSPFVVHTLGPVEYAIWSLMMVLTGYMGILDLGVRASTGRHVALYLGRGEHDRVDETIRTGLGFYSLIGLLTLAAGVALGWLFPSIFPTVPSEYHGLLRLLLPLMALNVWIAAFASVSSCVLAAHDRFDLARGIDLLVLGLRTIGTVLALKWGYGLVGLTMVVVTCNVVAALGNRILAGRVYPCLRNWPLMLSRERVRELLGYGIASFIISASVKIIGQTDLVIVGIAVSLSEVTTYSVGAMLVYYSAGLMAQIGRTFFPSLQRAAARHEMGPVRWLFYRQVRLAMIFGLPMYIGFIIFGRSFIRLWMLGPEFPELAVQNAAMVMVVLSASKLAYLTTIGSDQLLAAMGYIRFNALLTVVEALLNLSLSLLFVLVLQWGLVGVAMGTLVSRIMVRTFTVPWYACRKARLSWSKFLVQIGGNGLAAGGLFAVACCGVQRLLPCHDWLEFLLQVAAAMACYVPIAFLILVPMDDRRRVGVKLRSLLPSIH